MSIKYQREHEEFEKHTRWLKTVTAKLVPHLEISHSQDTSIYIHILLLEFSQCHPTPSMRNSCLKHTYLGQIQYSNGLGKLMT